MGRVHSLLTWSTKGFHHTLITFPTVSCFITVGCWTPQPTLGVTQVVLKSYSQPLQWKPNPLFIQQERKHIYISYGWCNSQEVFVRKVLFLSLNNYSKDKRVLLLGKNQGNLTFGHCASHSNATVYPSIPQSSCMWGQECLAPLQ